MSTPPDPGDPPATPTPPAPTPPAAAGPPPLRPLLDEVVGRELRASDIDSRIPAGRRSRVAMRDLKLPILLFLATCASTFWVGAADWRPMERIGSWQLILQTIQSNWAQGLTYMGCVLAILLTHEMGHFLMTLRHRIPASYPLCIPVPFNAIGTMGAVIGMDGMRANRKEIFDIGLAGPLAGLVVAIPILFYGVTRLDLSTPPLPGEVQLYNPVLVRWMIERLHPEWAASGASAWVGVSQVNAYYMAGWVGMLVTGLNMLPVSQLDGGHTIHGLFGAESHKIAQAFTVVAILYVVVNLDHAAMWTLMLVLVILMGIHHPPTADDSIELDDRRWIIGVASLSIPILCFPLLGIRM